MRLRTVPAALLTIAVLGLAPVLGAATPVAAASATGLASFGDCDGLLAHLKDVAQSHVSAYGFGAPGYGVFYAASAGLAFTGPETDQSSGSTAGGQVSSTNNQEAGADEADIVKTDGRRLVALRNDGVLSITDVTNAAKPVRTARLGLLGKDEYAYEGSLLMQGDRVLVLLPRWRPITGVNGLIVPGPFPGSEPITDLATISIADPAHPKVLDRVTIDGSLVAARLVNGSARVVINSLPLNLAFVTPQSGRGAAAALAANRKIINESTIADWLPMLTRGHTKTASVQCPDVRTPATFAGIGMTTVHTIPIGDRVQPSSASLQADASTVYASPTHVYVSAAAWVDPSTYDDPAVWDKLSSSFRTDIHEFDITGSKASYVASGQVRGHTLDRWSFSEHAGLLRVATTDGPTWSRPQDTKAPQSESFMNVLSARDGSLNLVGRVGGIGRGEQIRSVRYDGTVAYVVTFRQIDPFFVLDLSTPSKPAVVGQLKVAGYSGYLHPISAGRVLGVGADTTRQGQITGARVTLFDVSDLRHPKALSSWTLAGAQTQVEFDARAFLWWNPTNLAVVPTQGWGPLSATGAVGLRVTSRSITQVAFINHDRGGVKGATACRPLGLPEIKAGSGGNLVGYVVIDCAPGQAVTVNGFDCQSGTVAEINKNYGAHFTAAAGHRFGVCVLAQQVPVLRSIVVRDRLLTLSDRDILSSDLKTLAKGGFSDL